ncbi:MAG: hypothetical protein ACKO2C_05845 [Actinomycetes bacterium]
MTALPPSSRPGPDPVTLPIATDLEERERTKRPALFRGLMMSGAGAVMVALVMGALNASIEWVLAAIHMCVLGGITYLIARRLEYFDGDPDTFSLVMAGFSMKLWGSLLRMILTTVFYSGVADATEYDEWGRWLAPQYRYLDFSADAGNFSGTGFLRSVTGVIYAIFGSSKPGGYVIFGWLAFIGALLLWRGFKRTVPEGSHRRYAYLVFFLPSMIYWPSALGKDAFSVFCLGLVGYGVARVMSRGWVFGVPIAALGLAGVMYLRPHVALVCFVGMVLAAALGKSRNPSARTPIARTVVFGMLFLVGTVVIGQTQEFFGVSSLTQETVNSTLANAEGRTEDAGSTFQAVSVTDNPANFPLATLTVLFRPFPFEVHNVQSLLTAGEGVFLIYLCWQSRRRWANLWHEMRYSPYVSFCMGIVLAFIYAFSAFSNFGILARQRSQVMPFFLVFLCIAERERKTKVEHKPLEPSTLVTPVESPYAEEAVPDPYAAHREQQRAIDDPYARFPDLMEPRRKRWRRG